jgi:hypothetical protein
VLGRDVERDSWRRDHPGITGCHLRTAFGMDAHAQSRIAADDHAVDVREQLGASVEPGGAAGGELAHGGQPSLARRVLGIVGLEHGLECACHIIGGVPGTLEESNRALVGDRLGVTARDEPGLVAGRGRDAAAGDARGCLARAGE